MNSLEALDLLFKNVEENFKRKIQLHKLEVPELEKKCYALIKKDLEKLENLSNLELDLERR